MGYRRFRRPPLLGKRRTALVARFLTILKIFEICQKSIFGHFWGSLDTQGFRKCQFFCVLVDLGFLENFDFLGFLGGLEILAGGSGAVLVAHPPNHVRRMGFFKWWSLDTQGFRKCQFFCVLVDLGFLENFDFLGFLGGLEILAGGSGAVLVGVSRM